MQPTRASLVLDAPVSEPSADELGRTGFAQEVAALLMADQTEGSTVIAVEGGWGEGKTSVLRLVSKQLRDSELKPIVIEFDPWPEDSKRGVVSTLLDSIANEVARSPNVPPVAQARTAKVLRSLADAAANQLGATYTALLRGLSTLVDPKLLVSTADLSGSLANDRLLVQETMAQLPTRLVVIIDDLDRVDSEELRAIMMAVNALSRLRNTSFLLAFDPDVADRILGSQGFDTDGERFREKIVHISMPLPVAPFVQRLRLFSQARASVLAARQLSAVWEFWPLSRREEAEILAVRNSRSPRNLKRLVNHFAIMLGRLRTEINALDVLILEVVRAQFPSAWRFIRQHRNQFDRRDAYVEGYVPSDARARAHDFTDSPKNENKKSLIDDAIAEVPAERQREARQLLEDLFPSAVDEGQHVDRSELERQARVAIGRNLRKYFSMGVEGQDISNEDVRAFLTSSDRSNAVIQNAIEDGALSGFLSVAAMHVDEGVSTANIHDQVQNVMHAASTAWRERREDATESAVALIRKLIARVSQSGRKELLSQVMQSKESISTSHGLLLDLFEDANVWKEGVLRRAPVAQRMSDKELVSRDELFQLKDEWLNTVNSIELATLFDKEPRPVSILFRLGQFDGPDGNDYENVQKRVKDFLLDERNLATLVSQYSTQMMGISYAVDGLEKLIPDWTSFVSRVRSMKEPRDAIEKIIEYAEVLDNRDRKDH